VGFKLGEIVAKNFKDFIGGEFGREAEEIFGEFCEFWIR